MTNRHFDLIVLGSGAAGQPSAFAARKRGADVAVVESRELGGTCPNRGCHAKKVYVNASDAVDAFARLRGCGVAGEATIAWDDLVRFKRSFTDPVHEETKARLEEAGITAIAGHARFVDAHAIAVEGERHSADRFVIATGSRPVDLPFPGAEHVIDSDAFLELERLPRRVVFVGGGFVSFEFAHVAARAGAEVTILHRDRRPLPNFDAHVVDALLRASSDLGIRVHLEREAGRVEVGSDGVLVHCTGGGERRAFAADLVVHGAGRRPNCDHLGLDAAGIEFGDRGIPVDEHGRCRGAPHVYAGGDVADTGHPKLLRAASHHGRVIAAHLRGDSTPTIDPFVGVSVVFTAPRLAGVGSTEDAARAAGRNIATTTEPEQTWRIYREQNVSSFAFKTIVDAESRRILGAWALGHQADELINLAALAMHAKLTVDELNGINLGFPTIGGNMTSLFAGV